MSKTAYFNIWPTLYFRWPTPLKDPCLHWSPKVEVLNPSLLSLCVVMWWYYICISYAILCDIDTWYYVSRARACQNKVTTNSTSRSFDNTTSFANNMETYVSCRSIHRSVAEKNVRLLFFLITPSKINRFRRYFGSWSVQAFIDVITDRHTHKWPVRSAKPLPPSAKNIIIGSQW